MDATLLMIVLQCRLQFFSPRWKLLRESNNQILLDENILHSINFSLCELFMYPNLTNVDNEGSTVHVFGSYLWQQPGFWTTFRSSTLSLWNTRWSLELHLHMIIIPTVWCLQHGWGKGKIQPEVFVFKWQKYYPGHFTQNSSCVGNFKWKISYK